MEAKKKFELTNDVIEIDGITLHRIKALKDFSDVNTKVCGNEVISNNANY